MTSWRSVHTKASWRRSRGNKSDRAEIPSLWGSQDHPRHDAVRPQRARHVDGAYSLPDRNFVAVAAVTLFSDDTANTLFGSRHFPNGTSYTCDGICDISFSSTYFLGCPATPLVSRSAPGPWVPGGPRVRTHGPERDANGTSSSVMPYSSDSSVVSSTFLGSDREHPRVPRSRHSID
jgi:hypothetical protein